ncbi:MAG: hypothetical protein ABIZ80_13035 [Bryobacteraceae bacterium]
MDLRMYYQKIRETEQKLPDFPVLSSLESPDGGRPGVLSETTRAVGAKMIVEGRSRLATDEETQEFRAQKVEAQRIAEQMDASRRVQVTVISESDLRALKSGRSSK